MFRKIFSDAAYYMAGNIAAQLTGLFAVVAAMRMLTVQEFGLYSYAAAFVTFFSFVADGGLSQYVIKEISQQPGRAAEIYKNVQGAQCALSLIICIVLVVSAWCLHSREELVVILALGGGAIANGYLTPVFSALIAQQHRDLILKKDLVVAAVRLTYIGCFLLFNASLLFFALGNLVVALAALAFCGFLRRDRRFAHVLHGVIRLDTLCPVLVAGLPYSSLMLANILYNKIDVIMLKYLSGEDEVAVYGGATQFVYPFMFISTVLATAMFPHLAKNASSPREFSEARNKGALVMAGTGLALSAALFLSSDAMFTLFFGGKYDLSVPTYKILVWYLLIVFSYGAFSNALVAQGGVRRLLVMTACMLVLNVALNAWMIPAWGASGAATATLVCEFLILVCVMAMSRFISMNKQAGQSLRGSTSYAE